MEHLGFLGLAEGAVLAGVGLTRVVTALAHPGAVQHVAALLPEVVHHVVDVQHADAADQAVGDRRALPHTEREERERERERGRERKRGTGLLTKQSPQSTAAVTTQFCLRFTELYIRTCE